MKTCLLVSCRDLDFIANFFHTFGQEVHTVEDSLNRAYGETLKAHHGWATRGIFSVNKSFILI